MTPASRSPASTVSSDALGAYIRTHSQAIVCGDNLLRQDDTAPAELVHATRIAIRRLRSVLRTFRPLLSLGHEERRRLDADLRWIGLLLADVRDADVLRERLLGRVDDLPPEFVMGPIRQELRESIGSVRHLAVVQFQQQGESDRFREVLETLATWSEQPPLEPPVPSTKLLRRKGRKVLAKAKRQARARLEGAADTEGLHRARKSLKRLRYTADVLETVLPKAHRTANRARRLQNRLGNHQDLAIELAFLRHQAARYGGREGHNAFAYGVLLVRAEKSAQGIQGAQFRL